MATVRFLGTAPAISQVTDFVLSGTWDAADTITFTIGTVSVTMTTGSATITTILDNMVSTWNGLSSSAYPQFAEMTASEDGATKFTLTADTAGKPFTVTISTNSALGKIDGAASSSGTNSTSNSGPNDWNVGANWSGGSKPANTDDVVIEDTDIPIKYNLDQSSVSPTSLTIKNYRAADGIGLANHNGNYYEYRDTFLKFAGCATINIEDSTTGRIRLDVGGTVTCNVKGTGAGIEDGVPAVLLKGFGASSVLNLTRGSVGVAQFAGETATIATCRVSHEGNILGDAELTLGSGVTLATIDISGGTVEINSNVTTLTMTADANGSGGEVTIAAGAVTTLTCQGGRCIYNSTGTLGTATVSGPGHLDFSQDLRAKTVTNPIEVYGDQAQLSDPHKVVGSMVLDLNQGAEMRNLRLGRNIRLTRGNVA